MQPYSSNAKANAIQRTIGTMIGAFYGLLMILIEYYFLPFENDIIRYVNNININNTCYIYNGNNK